MQKYPSLKKLGFLLAAFLLVAGLFTACSGGDSDDTPTLIPKYVTITYNANYIEEGATAAKTVQHALTYFEGMVSVLYLPYNTFTRTGYKFLGWSTSSTSTKAEYYNGSSFSFRTDKTLYAIWEEAKPETVKITFDKNGGEGTMEPQIVTKSSVDATSVTATLNANTFTKSGSVFFGWHTHSSLSTYDKPAYFDEEEITLYSDKTLYAIWIKESSAAKITYNKNDSGTASETKTQYLEKRSLYSYENHNRLRANPFTRNGYTFKGWSTSENSSSVTYSDKESLILTTIDSDMTLYAVWEYSGTCTITFDKNASDAEGTMEAQSVTSSSSSTLTKNAFTRAGYNFIGWNKSSTATTAEYADAASFKTSEPSVTLYAVWQKIPAITFDANGGTGTMANQTIQHNKSIKLTKNSFTKEGFTFIGWSKTSTATSAEYADEASFTPKDSSVTLYAVWKKIPVITFDANGGAGTMENQTVPYNKSTKLTKNSYTREGYTFIGWDKTSPATTAEYEDESNITAIIDTKLYAVWKEDIQITLKANGGVGEDVATTIKYSPSEKKYTYTFPATTFTRDGYSFAGYRKNTSNTIYKEGETINPSASTIYYAQWKKDLSITLDSNGGTGGTSLKTAKYSSSEGKYVFTFPEATLSREGYGFVGWATSSTATTADYKTGEKSNPTNDTIYYAVWALNSSFTVSISTPTLDTINDISLAYDEASHSLKVSNSNETTFRWMVDGEYKDNLTGAYFNIYELSPGLHAVLVMNTSRTQSASVVVNVTRN